MLHWLKRIIQRDPRTPEQAFYTHPEQPNNGAAELVYHTTHGLPLNSYRGFGRNPVSNLMVLQPPQVFHSQRGVITGYETGVVAGTLYSQPLQEIDSKVD
jgi:hypothetical protein